MLVMFNPYRLHFCMFLCENSKMVETIFQSQRTQNPKTTFLERINQREIQNVFTLAVTLRDYPSFCLCIAPQWVWRLRLVLSRGRLGACAQLTTLPSLDALSVSTNPLEAAMLRPVRGIWHSSKLRWHRRGNNRNSGLRLLAGARSQATSLF